MQRSMKEQPVLLCTYFAYSEVVDFAPNGAIYCMNEYQIDMSCSVGYSG